MSNLTSPQRFSGQYDQIYDGGNPYEFENDVMSSMRVPKRIRVSGDHDEEPTMNWARYNGSSNQVEMNVPDKITIAGAERRSGSRDVPRELELDQKVFPNQYSSMHRVQTPPRNITLEKYSYPAIDGNIVDRDEGSISSPMSSNHATLNRSNSMSQQGFDTTGGAKSLTTLSPSDESQLIRRQVGKLNRRLMLLELDSQTRANREMFLYSLGVAYFIIKSIIWLNRS